jgi:hypothetical protein
MKKKPGSGSKQCTADFKNAGYYFFLRANYIMGYFKGCFEGAKTFLTFNLGVKKVEAPSKHLKKWPIMKFAQIKKK